MSRELPPDAIQPPPYVVAFGPDGNCTLDICPIEMSVYRYQPSLAANIAFIALYAVAFVMHLFLGVRWKQWWFMGCMLVGAVNAIIGYVGRVLMHYNPFDFAAFMIQIICVTTGPVYYCAAIYITLALSIKSLAPSLSRIPPNLFYLIFIPCDIVSLAFQAAGGALSTTSSGASQTGVNLALVGLAFQVFTILLFCGFFVDFLWRYFRSGGWRGGFRGGQGDGDGQEGRDAGGSGKMGVLDLSVGSTRKRLKLFFGFMFAAVVLTLVRCAYRLAELNEGYEGELVRDEPLFIALEGVMVLASVYCLMIGHPGLVFKRVPKEKATSASSEQELREYGKKGGSASSST